MHHTPLDWLSMTFYFCSFSCLKEDSECLRRKRWHWWEASSPPAHTPGCLFAEGWSVSHSTISGVGPEMLPGRFWMLLWVPSTTPTPTTHMDVHVHVHTHMRVWCTLKTQRMQPVGISSGTFFSWSFSTWWRLSFWEMDDYWEMKTLILNELVCTFLEKNLDLDDIQYNVVYLV